MPKIISNSSDEPRRIVPSLSPEAEDEQIIALAKNLAKKQLLEGTASSQVITHYLKLASAEERTKVEILELQKELVRAKTESIANAQTSKESSEKALRAFRTYSGNNIVDDDNDYVIYE